MRDEAADNGIAPAITAAMAPLDPRLGEEAEGLGLEWLLKNVEVLHAFPMHLWKGSRPSTASVRHIPRSPRASCASRGRRDFEV